jgi:DNA-binding NtrC family response regulator
MQVADYVQVQPVSESVAEARLRTPPPVFLGRSPAARRVQAMIHRAVRTNLPVLLVGRPGTGKHTVARVLHHFGGGDVPCMEVIVASAQPRLGSLCGFTYLADLEDLPPEDQARLPAMAGLGRVVLGTTLRPESEEGQRRLSPAVVRWASGVRIDLPTLAERVEDLEQLAMNVILRTPVRRPVGGIAEDALDCLRSYRWPGNLDEFEEVIVSATAAGATEQIELRDLPAHLRVRDAQRTRLDSPERHLCLEEAEKQAIRRALRYSRGNKRKAARLLHIGKTTLYRKLKQYDLD